MTTIDPTTEVAQLSIPELLAHQPDNIAGERVAAVAWLEAEAEPNIPLSTPEIASTVGRSAILADAYRSADNFVNLLGTKGFVMAHAICAYTYDSDPRTDEGKAALDEGRLHVKDYAKRAGQSRSTITNYREAYFYAARQPKYGMISEEVAPGEATPDFSDDYLFDGKAWSAVYKASRVERTKAATAHTKVEKAAIKASTDPVVRAEIKRTEELKGFGWLTAATSKVPTEVHEVANVDAVATIKAEIDALIHALRGAKKLIKVKPAKTTK